MERVPAASLDHDQARRLEHGEVLRDRLTGHAHTVFRGETRANLEQGHHPGELHPAP